VRVRNIPPEKRCDDHAAYAGSLVGVTLEVDQATLHKPEYCRILLGYRDINNLPETAESVLGDYFYIFSYEVETIVAQRPPVMRNAVTVTNTSVPSSPKRARTGSYSAASAASGDGQTGDNSQSVGTGIGRSHTQVLETVPERYSHEESEGYNEILIDTIARERRLKNAEIHDATFEEGSTLVGHVSPRVGKALPDVVSPLALITPVVEKEVVSTVNGKKYENGCVLCCCYDWSWLDI
jgi:hypothetical protein